MPRPSSPILNAPAAARLLVAMALCGLALAGSPSPARGDVPAGERVAVSGTDALADRLDPQVAAHILKRRAAGARPPSTARVAALDAEQRERKSFWAWDFRLSSDYALQAELHHASDQVWIYVEDGADVADLAIARLARAFEDQVQPRLRAEYGREPYPGVDDREALTVLLLDVRDDVYHRLPPFRYISGYFDPINQLTQAELGALSPRRSNEREMIFLDVDPTEAESDVLVQSAAHEYAHVIAWNYDPDEERWLDEVIGQLAIHVAGLPHPTGQLREYLAAPERSLLDWSGDTADYGQAYAFGLYLYEQLGGQGSGAAARLVQDPRNGLASLSALLPATTSIGALLRDFGLAVQLDLPAEVDPRFGFRALAIGGLGPDALDDPVVHIRTPDALPAGDELVVLPPFSLRFERYAVDGARLDVTLNADGPACFGTSWSRVDRAAGDPPLVRCAAGGRPESMRSTAPPPHGSLLTVIANASDRPLAITLRATILVKVQGVERDRLFLPFGLTGSGRARASR